MHWVSVLTLTSLSHYLGSCLRTYQSGHIYIWNKSPTAESERSECMVIRGDRSSLLICNWIYLVLSRAIQQHCILETQRGREVWKDTYSQT